MKRSWLLALLLLAVSCQAQNLNYTINQINTLLGKVDTTLNMLKWKTTSDIGYLGYDKRDSCVVAYVVDLDADGSLEELANAVTFAENRGQGFRIEVNPGTYAMSTELAINGKHRRKSINGNKVTLRYPAGYSGNWLTIAPDGDLNVTDWQGDLNSTVIENFRVEETESGNQRLWNGIYINPLNNGDVVHCVFRNIAIMYPGTGIKIVTDSVSADEGEYDWVNSNSFENIEIAFPDTPMVLRSAPSIIHIIRNTFYHLQVQADATTRSGIIVQGAWGNAFYACQIWDWSAKTFAPISFTYGARDNMWLGGSIEATTNYPMIDQGTNNFLWGMQVGAGDAAPMWNKLKVDGDIELGGNLVGDAWNGTASFSLQTTRKAVYVPGTETDMRFLATPSGDGEPTANDILRCYVKTDSVIVYRLASGTSALSFTWMRIK